MGAGATPAVITTRGPRRRVDHAVRAVVIHFACCSERLIHLIFHLDDDCLRNWLLRSARAAEEGDPVRGQAASRPSEHPRLPPRQKVTVLLLRMGADAYGVSGDPAGEPVDFSLKGGSTRCRELAFGSGWR